MLAVVLTGSFIGVLTHFLPMLAVVLTGSFIGVLTHLLPMLAVVLTGSFISVLTHLLPMPPLPCRAEEFRLVALRGTDRMC